MGTINSVKFNNTIFDQCSSEYVDLSKAVISPNEKAYHLSGLKIISEIIEGYIKEIADGVFIEYNLLGSVLDNNVKGESKLSSFTYTRENTFSPNFNENICKYTTAIIDALYDHDFTLFHHPDLFIDAIIPKVVYSLINEDDNCVINPEVERLIKDKLLSKNSPQINITSGESLFPILTPSLDPKQLLSDHQDSLIEHAQHKIYVGSFQFGRDYNYTIKLAQRIREEKNITLENAVNEFHKYYHTFLRNNSNLPNHTSVLMTIPVFGANSHEVFDSIKKQNIQGQSIIFLFFTVNKDKKNITELNESLSRISIKLYEELGNRIRFFAINYLFNLGIHLFRRAQIESLKSAKAAIMSRNMSHNLGSHVMFYIKQKLQSVSKIVDSSVLENIILPRDLLDIETLKNRISENTNVELPFLVGLGKFINYLQERQDYIATVATDYIPARSTISFKDFIYDELKPELRYQRHHSDGSSSDAGWQSGNLLLDYIAYSEQYRESSVIEIRFGQFNGTNPTTNSDADKDFQTLRKFNIAVPGGVIGRQAIFSIFENIIRNAAKHSGRRADGKMVIELSLLKEEDKKLIVDKVENLRCKRVVSNEEKGQDLLDKYTKYKDTYHVLRIKIDMPNKEEDIDNLVSKLGEKYVEADGSMLETSKGLKEMRISAAWLRGYSIDSEIPDDEPPVLSIYREPYKGSDYTLSYILCIPKPRKVAFVLNNKIWEQWKDKDLNKVIKPFGSEVFVVKEINEYYEKKYKENDTIKQADIISDFEIVCMPSDYKNIIYPSISSRYIADDGKIEEILTALYNYKDDEQKLKETIRGIYRIWFEATYPNSNSQLVIADEKASKDKEVECKILNEGKEDKDKVNLKKTSQMTQTDCTDNVVYSTHFKGLGFDATDYGQMLTASAYIESITGNNSTARLIRQDEWNEEWQYKLLSSGLAKVAIFDERIFSSFVTPDSASKHDKLFPTIDDIRKAKEEKQEQDFYDYLKGYGIHEDDASNIYYNLSTIEKVLASYSNIHKFNCDVAQRNHERRIYAFDIREADKETINVVGYNVNIEEHVGQYVNHENDAEIEIAHITYEDKNVMIELTKEGKEILGGDKGNIFDYITIHQGVLDKIYTAFGIKNDKDEKYKVTNALHKCFSKQDTPTDVKEFLPNFVIHSGRSKPSNNDMPQKQPFVQFAAVDHAVKDCKYTLVELLATAHYEK